VRHTLLRCASALTGVVLAGAALVGCGSQDSPAPSSLPTAAVTDDASQPTVAAPAAEPDPCLLLPKAEAEALAGTPLEDAVPSPHACSYTGPVSGPVAQVEVYVGDGAKKMLDIDRDTLAHPFTEVPGVGEEALAEDGVIFFRKGGVWVAIRLVRLNDPAENVEPLITAARSAAGRM
jgi:hypothetical protein